MITLFAALSLTLTLVWSIQSMNPIKVSMNVLVTSTVLFFSMGVTTGTTWFSILYIMLFMGGIIMMFMILSSILPNEKSNKTNMINNIFIWSISLSLISPLSKETGSTGIDSNTFLMSGLNFFFMMFLVLFYFMANMSTLSAEQTPMRSLICNQKLIL